MADIFDVYGQWFFLAIVYQYELLVLPVVAGILLLCKRHIWGRIVKNVLIFLILFYLMLFRMHWYSRIAWPLMLATMGFDWSRLYWYHILRFRTSRKGTALIAYIQQWWGELQRPDLLRDRRWLIGLLAVVVGGPTVMYFLSVPLDFLVLLAGIGVMATGLAWGVAVRAADERRFDHYVDEDPRLMAYLDCVRQLQADQAHTAGALLANNRMPSHGEIWKP